MCERLRLIQLGTTPASHPGSVLKKLQSLPASLARNVAGLRRIVGSVGGPARSINIHKGHQSIPVARRVIGFWALHRGY